jgi:hypothetical protein
MVGPWRLAYFPEKVTCPTLSTSKLVSGSSILRLPFSIATREREAKVLRTTIGKRAVGTFNEEHTLRQGPTILSLTSCWPSAWFSPA